MILKNSIVAFLFLLPCKSYASCSDNQWGNNIVNGISGCYSVEKKDDTFDLSISVGNKNFIFEDENADENAMINLYPSYHKYELSIVTGDDPKMDPSYEIHSYYWDDNKKDFFADRYTEVSYIDDDPLPNITTKKAKCCTSINNPGVVYEISIDDAKSQFDYIKKNLYLNVSPIFSIKDPNDENSIIIPAYWVADLNMVLDDRNVRVINDFAYFIQKYHLYEFSGSILKNIIKKYPDRQVSHLNLADVYWALGKDDLAKSEYTKYVNLMKKQKKEKNIPQQVYDRLK